MALALSTRSGWELPAYLWFGGLGVAAAVVDARVRRLPNAITAAWAVGTVAGLLVPAVIEQRGDDWLRAVLAGVTLTVVFGLVALSGALGWGDVKAAAAVGVILGWLGWVAVYAGMLAAAVLAGGWAVVLLARGRARRRTRIPLGPFLVAGAVIALTALRA
ncbi:prepilin peptidase [Actinoplanes sp. G11-F43]|uniref:prepilin peptidase n=1 Tax=Actinoplanes sp. G11-F43 TaxID=3424130 RepID=UPI003D337964